MPKFLEELQLKSLSAVIAPRDGVSIYNSGGVLKVLHSDGTEQQLMTGESTGIDFSQYYTKVEIDELLAGQAGFSVEVVDELPLYGESYIIYFVPNTDNSYDEYLYVNDKWELLGTTKVDLTGYAKLEDIPTNVSELQNDAGYLTSHQDLSEYAKKTELFSKNYNDLTNLPTIPTRTSQITNDSNYATKSDVNSSLRGYATESWVTAKNYVDSTTLENKGYATVNQISDKVNYSDLGSLAFKDAVTKADIGLSNVSNVASYSKSEVDTEFRAVRSELTAAKNNINSTFQDYYKKTEADAKFMEKGEFEGLATQDYVREVVSELVGSAPDTLDTIHEIATAIEENKDTISTLETIAASKADKDSVYTKSEVDDKIADISIGDIDLTGYATEEWVTNKNYVNEEDLLSKGYATKDELSLKVNMVDLGSLAFESSLSKADVGLGNVNNTSDLDKPISTAVQTALNEKANRSELFNRDYQSLMNKPVIPDRVSDLVNDLNYIDQTVLDTNYYTKAEVNDKLSGISGGSGGDLSNYYTKTEIDNKLLDVDVDLTNYYTKADTDAAILIAKNDILDGVGSDFDTLKEVSDWINDEDTGALAMTRQISRLSSDLQLKANTSDVYNKTEIENLFKSNTAKVAIRDWTV